MNTTTTTIRRAYMEADELPGELADLGYVLDEETGWLDLAVEHPVRGYPVIAARVEFSEEIEAVVYHFDHNGALLWKNTIGFSAPLQLLIAAAAAAAL